MEKSQELEVKLIRIEQVEQDFTKTELAHLLNAIEKWGETVKSGIQELNDKAESKGKVCLFAPSYADGLVRDLKIKLRLTDNLLKIEGNEIFKI
jgi:hypothetical protein